MTWNGALAAVVGHGSFGENFGQKTMVGVLTMDVLNSFIYFKIALGTAGQGEP